MSPADASPVKPLFRPEALGPELAAFTLEPDASPAISLLHKLTTGLSADERAALARTLGQAVSGAGR